MAGKAFNPCGKAFVVVAATTAPAGTAVSGDVATENQYRIANSGTVGVFYAYSSTSAADAQTKADTTPSGATGQYNYYLPAGGVEIITADATATVYFSAKAVSGTANVYISRGVGL